MLIVFTTAKIWDQPKCPKMDDWGKMWHINTMEYYLAIKSEIMSLAGEWN
jgi:hypothetical protein